MQRECTALFISQSSPERGIVSYFKICWLRSFPLGHWQFLAYPQVLGATENKKKLLGQLQRIERQHSSVHSRRSSTDFSAGILKSRREMHNIFKVLKGKKIPTKNTLSIKVGPQNCRERYRDFQTNKQKKKWRSLPPIDWPYNQR